jgi:CubicO group peptidase (beta-lactamase class C family)
MKRTLAARPLARAVAALVAVLCLQGLAPAQSFTWRPATPESQGVDGRKLDALRDELARRRTRALLVVRNDRLVYEWYARGVGARSRQGTASLAKALVVGLSLGVALTDGLIKLDDPAAKYIPQWKGDPKKARITVRQLGSHTSGLSDSTTEGVGNEDQPGWKGDFWKRLPPPDDPFTLARDRTPLLFEPGGRFQYSNPGIGLLGYCVTAAIKGGKHRDIRSLLKERVLKPIGVPDADWSAGYGKTFTVNSLPLVGAWGGASFTPRAAVRLGRLVLRRGDWDSRRLLSREAVRQVTQDAGLPGHCGMGWWTNNGRRYPWLPRDAVWGAGAGDQVLLVVPSLKLIVVRNGEELATAAEIRKLKPKDVFERYHDPRARILFRPLVEAVTDRAVGAAPYPPSRVISRIDWAPQEAIVRRARGSDNWPLTWADDGHLYTAYGDGHGFEPLLREKLGLGIARVEGPRRGSRASTSAPPASRTVARARRARRPAACSWSAASSTCGPATPATPSWPGRRTAAGPGGGPAGSSRPASAARRSSTSARTTPWRATTSCTSTRPTPTAPTGRPTAWCWAASGRRGSRIGTATSSSRASTTTAGRAGRGPSASAGRCWRTRAGATARASRTTPG